MELAIEILNKEIERREILLAVETNVLIQNDMHNEIGGLKDVVKKLTIDDVIDSACFDYVDGINMDCAKCGQPKYRHK